ncbi:MAG: cobalt transporter CbiM [Cyanothece sp. SIO1E1]|nr:cobalt transporter CbiM [Cyanothece sp. SIO1E1]
MHISDGLLPARVCIGGYAITGLLTWYTLRQINQRSDPTAEIPKASLLIAAFFAAASIRVPIPPTSVHLVLNGALGAVLGWYAFPAILIGLFLQALVFGHGGLTTLGVNAVMIGVPALLAAGIFQWHKRFERWLNPKLSTRLFSFIAGALGLAIAALVFFTLVITTIPSGFDAAIERKALYSLMVAHVPLMLLEGIFTMLLVSFLSRVQPGTLNS